MGNSMILARHPAVDLTGPFDLALERTREPRRFAMETTYTRYACDGTSSGTESYLLDLVCTPQEGAPDRYTCVELAAGSGAGPRLAIPELHEWTYRFDMTMSGADGRGPLWGISQQKFLELSDGRGNPLPFSTRYAAYTSLIDFHSVNDVFTRPMGFGHGIQDLRQIGDRAVHPASFIQAAVGFGDEIKPGSTFTNGEVALELKGVSLVDGATCALVGYDAGESRLRMILPAPGGAEAVTQGVSLYRGDICVDLATGWVRRATLDEHMASQVAISGRADKVDEFTSRHVGLRLLA